jgi:ABC-type Zn2+ transport system substrate-binding protein/surface adhesin
VIREIVPRGPPSVPLPPGYDDDERDAEEDITEDGSQESQSDEEEIEDSEEDDDTDDHDDTDEEEWVPPTKFTRSSTSNVKNNAVRSKVKPSAKISKLQREMDSLSLSNADNSMEVITPKKKRSVIFDHVCGYSVNFDFIGAGKLERKYNTCWALG